MRTFASVVAIMSILFLIVNRGCERIALEEIPVIPNVTFDEHIKPITSKVCIECHSQGSSDYSRYKNAYMMRYFIYKKVAVEKSMPLGKYLSDEDRALFRDWFNQGSIKN